MVEESKGNVVEDTVNADNYVNSVWTGIHKQNKSNAAKINKVKKIVKIDIDRNNYIEEYSEYLEYKKSHNLIEIDKFLSINYEKPMKIITFDDIVEYLIKNYTGWNLKLDITIWRKIFKFIGPDNVDMMYNKEKKDSALMKYPNSIFGHSLCGIPYGIWKIIEFYIISYRIEKIYIKYEKFKIEIEIDDYYNGYYDDFKNLEIIYQPPYIKYTKKYNIPITRLGELLNCNPIINKSCYKRMKYFIKNKFKLVKQITLKKIPINIF